MSTNIYDEKTVLNNLTVIDQVISNCAKGRQGDGSLVSYFPGETRGRFSRLLLSKEHGLLVSLGG